ncbi:two-component system phosphate regulon sensor histidine kinase PhoR [Marinoscillum furvescens DSM 4134]|uniref:histidine kinase n=2 Tax=Marinoscillum furvescens TaxID=1026 RepID=A0A3D9L495_MARFU|nr:two-component system phosphate regulon sensor histidine kinase PhoR [Marinoscillum furvescens DSM 4134]
MVALMSLALLGLIGFQWFWIDSVIRANEERFKRDAMEAIHAVSEKLEKQEALYAFHQAYPFTGVKPPQPPQPAAPGSPGVKIYSDTLQSGQGLNIVFDFQAQTAGGSIQFSAEHYEGPRPKLSPGTQNYLDEHIARATRKSEMVFQVLENMLISERSVMSRFNPHQLDSLLAGEFRDRGIDIPFNYAVVSPINNRLLLINNRDHKEALEKSELRASLFPNDLIGEQNWLVVNFPDKQQYLLSKIWLTMASSGLLVLVIVGSFGYSIHTILRQKKLSEMKNDFINNMTHELKTPIATISLACEALSDREIKQMEGMRERYLKMIGDENKRLGEQVERVLHMAALDRNDIELKCEVMQLKELVEHAREKTMIQVESRQGTIRLIDNAPNIQVYGDPTHLTNILVNLLENANKYSNDAPDITIRMYAKGKNVHISVQDRGIGMTKEAQNHIFQKFYRVPTGDIHNVKGFGLGLAYVKTMVEMHSGTVSVESEWGKGSKFTITLPVHHGEA